MSVTVPSGMERRRYEGRGEAWLRLQPGAEAEVVWVDDRELVPVSYVVPREQAWETFERQAGLAEIPWQAIWPPQATYESEGR